MISPSLLNILDAVAIMSHAVVNRMETRKLREIIEIVNVDSQGIAVTNTPFLWDAKKNVFYFKKDSQVFRKISQKFGISIDDLHKEMEIRAKLLFELKKRGIFDFHQTQRIINEYHKNPDYVLSAFGILK